MIVILFLTTLIAAFLQTVTGFGFGLITVSTYALGMGLISAVAVSNITSTVLSGVLVKIDFKKVNFKLLLYTLLPALIAGCLGVVASENMPEATLKRILGETLVILSIYFMFFQKIIKFRRFVPLGIVIGLICGLLQGMVAMGGPPMALYYLCNTDSKEEYMGTLQLYFETMNVITLAMRILQGQIDRAAWLYSLLLMIPLGLGILGGRYVFSKLEENTVKKAVYIFMLICGVYFFISGV